MNEYFELAISPEMMAEAERNASQYNDFNVFLGAKDQKLAGELGQIVFRNYLLGAGIAFHEDKTLGRRDLYDFKIGNLIVSVKSRLLVCKPKAHWECDVHASQLGNPGNIYVFVHVLKDFSRAFIVGWMKKADFDAQGIDRKVGDLIPAGSGQWAVKYPMRVIAISQLSPIGNLPLFIDRLRRDW
jgi:hypothetical protein